MSESKVSRQQLAQFIKDPRTLRAFELITTAVQETIPIDLDSVSYEAGQASNNANLALSLIERFTAALELIALAPMVQTGYLSDDIQAARIESGNAMQLANAARDEAARLSNMIESIYK